MTYDSSVYKMLKEELKKRGNWKDRPRGRGDARRFGGKVDGERTDIEW